MWIHGDSSRLVRSLLSCLCANVITTLTEHALCKGFVTSDHLANSIGNSSTYSTGSTLNQRCIQINLICWFQYLKRVIFFGDLTWFGKASELLLFDWPDRMIWAKYFSFSTISWWTLVSVCIWPLLVSRSHKYSMIICQMFANHKLLWFESKLNLIEISLVLSHRI